jgi:hypothetical protein
LLLVVQPSGVKSFVYRFKTKGPDRKSVKITLRRFVESSDAPPQIGSPLTLVGARFLAGQLSQQRATGVEPSVQTKTNNTGRDYPTMAPLFIERYP